MVESSNEYIHPKKVTGEIKYNRTSLIKKAAFGLVFAGVYKNEEVRVKRIAVHRVQHRNSIDLKMNLNHDNVVKLLTVEGDEDFWFIVTKCYKATLTEVIEGKYQGSDLPPDISVLQQLINGLCYIHLKQLVHGDIKPDNVVISTTGQIQISSDFGICKLVRPRDTIIMDEYENTALWMAPEILIAYNDPSFDDDVHLEFTPNSDIFSSGCVFFVFATRKDGGVHPYGDRRNHLEVLCNMKAKQQINVEKLTTNCLANIVMKMIAHEPQDRPSGEDIKRQLEQSSSSALPSTMTQPSASSESIHYYSEKQLGKGYFGCVYSGLFNGKLVAVKVIPQDVVIPSHKAELQLNFLHENVLKFLKIDTRIDGSKYVALELCATTLDEVIERETKLAITQAQVMYQIASGLAYIHSMNTIHGAIKPSNILVSNSNNKQAIIKLSDFGYSKTKSQVIKYHQQRTIERHQWMAPELLSSEQLITGALDESNGSIKSDTFSAGIVYFYYIKTKIHPFGHGLAQIKENIMRNNILYIRALTGHPAHGLIELMLSHNPENRPEMSHVRNTLQRFI